MDAVLIGGREERPIVIVEYDSQWPSHFEALAGNIKEAVADVALSVEHIGSTSVPGLAAKPIVDILVTVADVADENSYLGKLEAAGFVLRVREAGHRMMRTPCKDVHIHLFSADNRAEIIREHFLWPTGKEHCHCCRGRFCALSRRL